MLKTTTVGAKQAERDCNYQKPCLCLYIEFGKSMNASGNNNQKRLEKKNIALM
jgi:hypothetical protein